MALLRALFVAAIAALAAPAGASAALQVETQGAPGLSGPGMVDGMLAAGDSFGLVQTLLSSESSLTGVSGRLTTTTPGVTITADSSGFSDAGFGGTTANATPFQISIGPSVACGTKLDFTLGVAANQGTADLPLKVGTGLAGPLRNVDAVDVPRTIPDGGSIVSSFEVGAPGLIKDVRVRIGRITHGYVGDLRLTIEAPDGTTVILADRQGGSGDDFVNTVFASTGTALTAGAAPFTGTFRAQGDLSVLDGRQQQGTWRLRIADTQLSDAGTLVSWGGSVAQAVCSGNPIPSFTATPNPVAPGATASLSAAESLDPTPGGSIVKYEWDLDGNGSFEVDGGTSPTASRSWPTKGTVNVGLRVTDNEGNAEVVTSPVYVTAAPSAALTFLPAEPVTGQTVTLDAAGSTDADGTIIGHAWDLDANGSFERSTGATSTTQTSFATPGTHVVRVRVTDDTGATDVERVEVPVTNRAPTARLSVPAAPIPGQQVTLSASASTDPDGTIVRHEWDLDGNGSYEVDSGPGSSTARSFAAAGSYPVGVRITDDSGATATAAATVSVDAPPLPALAVWPSPGVAGKPVYFGASGSTDPDGSITRYEWDLDGDGAYELDTGTLDKALHSYATAGTRTVRLRVTDNRGVSAVTSAPLRIDAPAGVVAPGTGTDATGDGGGDGDGGGGAAGDGSGATPDGALFSAALLGPPIQAVRLARSAGLSVSCRVSAGARCSLTVYLPAAAVRRLRLARSSAVRVRRKAIGRVTILAAPGRDVSGRIILSATARRALRGVRSTRVVIRGGATDAAGRRVSLVRVVLLRG